MRSHTRLLVSLLLLVTSAYAIAEELTLVTYYPSPRGVYNELRTMGTTLLAQQTGSVGIGTTTPQAKLDVSEGIKVGYQTACDADRAGTVRYNSKKLEVCDGSDWVQAMGGAYVFVGSFQCPSGDTAISYRTGPSTCPPDYPCTTPCTTPVHDWGSDNSTVETCIYSSWNAQYEVCGSAACYAVPMVLCMP